jgi:hypothetical protein
MGDASSQAFQQLLDPDPIPDVRTFNDKVSPKLSAVLSLMCAKKREDRLASPKAVIDTFVRLGYAAPSSGETEFAAEEDPASDGMVQDLIPDIKELPKGAESLTLETQDRDVQEFLTQLRHKRNRKRIIWIVVVCLLLLLAELVQRFLL